MSKIEGPIQPHDPETMGVLYDVSRERIIDKAPLDEMRAIQERRNAAMGEVPPAPPDITEYLELRSRGITQPPTQGEQ